MHVLLLAACQRTPDSEATSPLKIETRSFQESLPGCGDKEKREAPCVTFRITYPEVMAAPAEDIRIHINAEILASLQPKDQPRGFDAESEALIREYQALKKEFPDTAITYYVRRTAEIRRDTAWILSIEVTQDSYLGGAHANSRRSYLNINPQTGVTLQLEDIIRDGASPKLAQAAERAFRQARGIPREKSLGAAGFNFPADQFALNRTWGVTRQGLIFFYNEYEIAAYSEGPTEVKIPWSELQEVIKRETGLLPRP